MNMSDEELDELEKHIPELAEVAFKEAYSKALASGSSVLVTENGKLLEVFPDGTRKFRKKLAPWTPAELGKQYRIQFS